MLGDNRIGLCHMVTPLHDYCNDYRPTYPHTHTHPHPHPHTPTPTHTHTHTPTHTHTHPEHHNMGTKPNAYPPNLSTTISHPHEYTLPPDYCTHPHTVYTPSSPHTQMLILSPGYHNIPAHPAGQGGQMSRAPAFHSGRSGNPKIVGPSLQPGRIKPIL